MADVGEGKSQKAWITLDVPWSLAPITSPSAFGQCRVIAEGRTRRAMGGSYCGGFATALPRNTRVIGPQHLDLDLASIDEDDGGPTCATITSRSYHPGGVNVLMGDASVRSIKNSIGYQTWRVLGTIAGAEAVSADAS